MLDLCLPPFELPRDVSFWAADYVYPYPRREMCVWTRQQIAAALPTMVGKGLFATHDVALRKPAKQSSVSRWSRRPTVDQDAAGANSGAVLQAYAFHTDYEVDPWWEVDLLSEFYIEKIIILNSENHPERLLNFSLLKSSDGNNWEVICQNKGGSGPQGPESTVFVATFPADAHVARFVRIRLDGQNFLHLRTFQVFGRPVDQ